MSKDSGIFVFTRDRPQSLRSTLNSISARTETVFVIDDSKTEMNRSTTKFMLNISKHVYLGQTEFNDYLNSNNIDPIEYSFLIRRPGHTAWNLGYSRNFALLYAKSLRLTKVLFMDDDIDVPSLNVIDNLFESLTHFKFTGAHISGLVDDSVLGHIATDIGITNERMLSGGFMAFNPNRIEYFFLNNYNEDWIWLFLQLNDKNYMQSGEVFQKLTNPLSNYKNKSIFQEFGEIALDGILDLYKEGNYAELVQLSFWERIIKERKEYLDLLFYRSVNSNKKKYREIIEHVKLNSQNLSAEIFRNLFKKYSSDTTSFKRLYNSIA